MSHIGTVAWLRASLRWMRHNGWGEFTIHDIYAIYSVICPPKSVEPLRSIQNMLSRRSLQFGLRIDGKKKVPNAITSDQNSVNLYTWSSARSSISSE